MRIVGNNIANIIKTIIFGFDNHGSLMDNDDKHGNRGLVVGCHRCLFRISQAANVYNNHSTCVVLTLKRPLRFF